MGTIHRITGTIYRLTGTIIPRLYIGSWYYCTLGQGAVPVGYKFSSTIIFVAQVLINFCGVKFSCGSYNHQNCMDIKFKLIVYSPYRTLQLSSISPTISGSLIRF